MKAQGYTPLVLLTTLPTLETLIHARFLPRCQDDDMMVFFFLFWKRCPLKHD